MKLLFESWRQFISEEESPRIIAIGDSITAMKGSYIDLLGGEKFAKGGQTSRQRILFNKVKDATAGRSDYPDYIILFMGTNNIGAGDRRYGARFAKPEDENPKFVSELIADLGKYYGWAKTGCAFEGKTSRETKCIPQDHSATVIVLPLFPAYDYWFKRYNTLNEKKKIRYAGWEPNLMMKNLNKVNQAIAEISDIPISNESMLEVAVNWKDDGSGLVGKNIQEQYRGRKGNDYIHPNKAGHAALKALIKERLF